MEWTEGWTGPSVVTGPFVIQIVVLIVLGLFVCAISRLLLCVLVCVQERPNKEEQI